MGLLALGACAAGCRASKPEGASRPAPQGAAGLKSARETRDAAPPRPHAAELAELLELVRRCSEPSAEFFDENLVSNEDAYLQSAEALAARKPGGAYIGVGPGIVNYSLIALTKPELAVIVDIRKNNQLLHFLHKAIFHEAADRRRFLELLLGRTAPKPAGAPARGAPENEAESLAAELGALESLPADATLARANSARALRYLRSLGIPLGKADGASVGQLAHTFVREGLGLRFSHRSEREGSPYPTLRELLLHESPSGAFRSFLATDASYGYLRDLSERHRIVPLVGDLAGPLTLGCVGQALARRGLAVSTLYVSNVEEYLLVPGRFDRWRRNAGKLVEHADAVFLRSYLDRGRRHPTTLPGKRSATVLQPASRFLRDADLYRSYWQVTEAPLFADGVCAADGTCRELPATREHCARSSGCRELGLCSAEGARCVAKSNRDCERSARCRLAGDCRAEADACRPKTDDDCRGSELCRSTGSCSAVDGFCVRREDGN